MEILKDQQSERGQEMELREVARENFSRWAGALETKDPNVVAAMYSENASFHPTMSGDFKRGVDGAREYFTHFLQKNPKGELVEGGVVCPIGECAYSHDGVYEFEVDGDNGERIIIPARFTFNWMKDEKGEWKITTHHSSVVPHSA